MVSMVTAPNSSNMSEQESDRGCTVFAGSSPEDVSHARQLWSSLSLLPPLESRLVSADIRQRLPVSRPQRRGSTAAPAAPSAHWAPSVAALRQRQEERQRYAAMAEQRREILALLGRQRERRLQRELLSAASRPKEEQTEKLRKPAGAAEEQLVQQLQ